MRSILLLCGALISSSLSGCATNYQGPVRPPPGLLFSSYKAPVTTRFDGVPASSPRVGRSGTTYILIPLFGGWDFAFDDARIKKAADRGGITRIHYIDHEFFHVLGLFGTYETVVYGE